MASPQRRQGGDDVQPNPNVFDDEYETNVPDTELDHRPFRPSAGQEPNTSARARSRTRSRSRPAKRRSAEREESAERSSHEPMRRSSIAKDPRDLVGARSAATRMPSEHRHRPISTASEFAHHDDRSATPVHTRSGSGFTANGFSQSGLPRHSIASSQTPSRRPSQYMQTGPAFPYALYNQTTLPADDDDVPEVPTIVGFPTAGRTNAFERRIGPDGEEQDILGPDGHTEQLPPYSKYPDGHAKPPSIAVLAVAPDTRSTSPAGEGLTTSTAGVPPRTPGLEAGARGGASDSEGSSFDEKKPWKEKTFKEKRKTKVCCGIPLWMLVSVIAVVLLCGAVIGGVVGGLMATRGNSPVVTVTSTATMLDAKPIASPTGIAPIPTGVFELPFGIPQEQQRSCLTNGDQFNTWACNTPEQPMVLRVGNSMLQNQYMDMWPNTTQIPSNASQPLFRLTYGAQYPKINTPQRLYWVKDLEDPGRGPALHFQTLYDKLVILNDDQFRPSMAKRGVSVDHYFEPNTAATPTLSFSVAPLSPTAMMMTQSSDAASSFPTDEPDKPEGGFRNKKNILSVGERPWFCWWNQTWIEGFVYMQTYTTNVKASNYQFQVDKREEGETPSKTSPVSGTEQFLKREIKERDADFAKAQALYRDAIDSLEKRWASPGPKTPVSDQYIPPAPTQGANCLAFPYIMKMQERRIPCEEQIAPYCQKMFIPPEGPPIPVQGNDGQPIIVQIQEDSPPFEDQLERFEEGLKGQSRKMKRLAEEGPKQLAELYKRNEAQSCHCHWVTPPPPS